eukprot:jgi/Botrbrau1/16027/Bobra.7_2s0002.1
MAKKGAKKQIEDNRRRLRLLQIIITVANVIQVPLRFGLRRSTVSVGNYVLLGLTSLVYAATYGGISSAARPTYGENGELIDGGNDLKHGGVLSAYHDLLYLTAAAQLLSLFSPYCWFLLLLAPAYGFYQLWVYVPAAIPLSPSGTGV